ncbi:MAG: lipooligosaccharide sialyltransferase [Lachnospiraceae bacterium]|nr:lipooligosaccharide sialyltransferase [Lachnospiraceae bacterium]
MRERIYVCHTYYHVYIACLKELARREGKEDAGKADLVLSKMSNDFRSLKARAQVCGLFDAVIEFDEKDYTFFPELVELKKDRGNIAANMLQRIRFCRRYAELEAPYVPVDFAQYQDIYVFCDSDPIGYYLSWKKIRYHAVEDGLDCIRYRDTARDDNRGHFALKAFMAAQGLIFIQNGYGKYCIDMEVNDLSALDHPIDKMVEVPRDLLTARLTDADKDLLTRLFIENRDQLAQALGKAGESGRPKVLILTEPLCKDLAMRRRLFEDMIREYGTVDGQEAVIVVKPHPRDKLDYTEIFPQHIVLDGFFPMEILNFVGREGEMLFDRVVTVFTVPSSIHCAREKVYLGAPYMDRYEDPEEHRSVTNSSFTVTRTTPENNSEGEKKE